jgi:hypothetical protein
MKADAVASEAGLRGRPCQDISAPGAGGGLQLVDPRVTLALFPAMADAQINCLSARLPACAFPVLSPLQSAIVLQ